MSPPAGAGGPLAFGPVPAQSARLATRLPRANPAAAGEPGRLGQVRCQRSRGSPCGASRPCGRNGVTRTPAPDSESTVTIWEYATAPLISHALQQILNQWGDDGWELVTVENDVAYFKRPKE